MVSEPNKTFEVFFSYSHKDQDLRDQLETQLSLLKRQEFISSWHDRKIGAGEEWAKEIDVHLNTAQIILLLISADFIASDYCYEKEMTRALERHKSGEARVIPIILRPCDWHNSPFGKLQALPTGGQAVTDRSWYSRDEAFSDVAKGIRETIEKLRISTASTNVNDDTSRGLAKTDLVGEKLILPKLKVNKSFNPYKIRDEWIDYII
ncbi:MAG TPA: toll/interleukin-1 receptor domain-containing protein [Ktedonobacteraceae bacterium]|nr:toll/interleukin-1 receptor domain-containing protein [Ktedonobacteraceae bacterium]